VPHQSNAVHSIVVAAQRPAEQHGSRCPYSRRPPVDGALLAPQKPKLQPLAICCRRLTAPEQTGPRDTQSSQCIPTARHGYRYPISDASPGKRALLALINIKLQPLAFCCQGSSLPRANFPSEHLSSTTPTEPRNTVPDASCKTQLSQGALLAPQKRQAAIV
jgi:hypothetical protein